jgi:hypothetical protein
VKSESDFAPKKEIESAEAPGADVHYENVTVTDPGGNRWDRTEWLEMGNGKPQWETAAFLTLKIEALQGVIAEAVPTAEVTDDERYRWCEELAALRARVAELEGVIAEHNKRCERDCADTPIRYCQVAAERFCDGCPRRYMLEVK